MKKIIYITIFITILLVCFLGITYSFEYNKKESLTFELIGPSTLYIDVGNKYIEYGIKVINNGIDISSNANIDSSSVDTNKIGEYKVKYEIDINDNIEYIYRIIKVVDTNAPQIKIKGDETVYLILNGSYYEEGYTVTDNYDTDIESKVEIIGNIDTSKVGEYKLEYKATDSNGNTSSTYRTIIVVEPKITLADISGNRIVSGSYNVTQYENTIVRNYWTNNGIYIEGYVKNNSNNYIIKFKNKENSLEYTYNLEDTKNNYYSGNIDLTKLSNGEYDIYIIGNKEEKVLNKLSGLSRLLRTKIDSKLGSKLVTITYDSNDQTGLIIEDFKYEYDIVIDPGHGGPDVGASNGIKYEKDINLEQSMYEKCRYESMGLKVYMTRYDDTYGTMMGTNSIDELQRRAFTVGYYGAVSKVTYSNHHNASINKNKNGFEMLVANSLSKKDLVVERNLYSRFKEYYGIKDDAIRLYSRDYNTDKVYDKLNGEVYDYMDYYAMIRIPKELYNVNTTIYEPIYMSNPNEFSWYYTNKKWLEVTEIKIMEYVNYLGATYNKDNSMCL